jgi:hypothetical protein
MTEVREDRARSEMKTRKRPKLYPPKALLWEGPIPALPRADAGSIPPAAILPPAELRRIVQEMLG